jgi:uncharacterized membrane protein
LTEDDRRRQRLEIAVHWALLAGLAVSVILMVIGLVLALGGGQSRSSGPPPSLAKLLRGALKGNGRAWIDLGLIALIATPGLRVIVLGIGWSIERQWRFAAVAATVLALLTASLLLGTGG